MVGPWTDDSNSNPFKAHNAVRYWPMFGQSIIQAVELFYATGKSDYEFPFLFANPCLYPLSARPLSSDQIKEIDQTIPIPCRPKSWSSPTWIWFSRENRELQRWEPWKARSRIRKQKPRKRKPQEWRLVESRLLSFFAPFSLNDSFEFADQKFYMSILSMIFLYI